MENKNGKAEASFTYIEDLLLLYMINIIRSVYILFIRLDSRLKQNMVWF